MARNSFVLLKLLCRGAHMAHGLTTILLFLLFFFAPAAHVEKVYSDETLQGYLNANIRSSVSPGSLSYLLPICLGASYL